jgi:xylan 1,4-beta-xylosidase
MKTQSLFDAPRSRLARAARRSRATRASARTMALALALALLGLGLANGRPANAASYTITVDAATQTAGNPHFWAASVGTGTASLTLRADLQTHYKIANRELGMQRVRGHGVLNDDIGVYKAAGSYDWTKFDTYLNAIVSAGMRPIMELSFMPTALAKNGSSRDVPKDFTAYKQFIQAVVQHCVDKYGAADVGQWYWEVWNEPDYAGFWNGTIDDYYTLYDNAVDGATAVLPNILIGGPATTEPSKIAAFLQHCKSANKRVTFVSSHVYPGGDGTANPNATTLVNDNNSRLSQITSGGYTTATVKSFNTEWNSSFSGQGGKPGDATESMDSQANAAFILKGVKLLSDKNQGETPPLDVFSYWVASDIFDESSGSPSGSYILGQGGNLPFGQVFGLMTFQGVRKAAFNGFKMLNYLGPKRLMSGGGTGSDGVDGMATMSANSDEVQILVYNYYATVKTTGTDDVTVTVKNLPATLAGKALFVTHFRVDDSHSNPYGVWLNQAKPTNPTEVQWQAMRQAQHLALLQPVSQATVTTTYTTSFSLPRQGGSLIILGVKRPVTGRNALVEIEGEDYDGQSAVTKEDSNDTTVGQSIAGNNGSYVFFDNVDFSDAGVSAVQLRVNAQTATTLQLRADSQTGALLGTCQVSATGGSWATQACTLTQTTGVHTLYVVLGGAVRLNYMKFQQVTGDTGTGGLGGGGGADSGAGGGGNSGGSGGAANVGVGGSNSTGSGGAGIGSSGAGGGVVSGSGGSGTGGSSGAGGSAHPGGGGCACGVGDAGGSSGTLLIVGIFAVVATVSGLRKRRPHRADDTRS